MNNESESECLANHQKPKDEYRKSKCISNCKTCMSSDPK